VQEVADNFPDLEGNDDRDQFAELRALLPGYACIPVYGVDRRGRRGRRRRFGNAIFSRYTVLSARRHALPWPNDPGKKTMPRVAVEATLQAPMGPVRSRRRTSSTTPTSRRRAQVRRLRNLHDEACQRAMAFVRYENEESNSTFNPTPQTLRGVVVGDFNFPPEHASYQEIQSPLAVGGPRLRDAWTAAHGNKPHAPTFCVHDHRYAKGPYCCDFAFVSEDLGPRVRSVEVDSATRDSDHQPVLLVLDDT
jgi:endonuclease/exonuclease/phosphatase family metal-dependent hydrolase